MSGSVRNLGWLKTDALQKLLGLLEQGGEEARINGGAVRNALLGEPVNDIDISTTMEPQAVVEHLERASIKVVPTGIEHGTVTAILDGQPYEITTLREDIETDGRRAIVSFGRDWEHDALRRDFTINALYMDADGEIFDPLGAMDDLSSRTVRFVGDPDTRIREDYLRILRFFRFFAWYGMHRPDADGLKACARLKRGLAGLSAERTWAELKKLLSAPDPSRALLWMRQTGVLTAVLPESENWGIDAVPGLIEAGRALGWEPDPMLRLMAMVPKNPVTLLELAGRLRLSKAEARRLQEWAAVEEPDENASETALAQSMYRTSRDGMADALKLAIAKSRASGNSAASARYAELLAFAGKWRKPRFPVGGKDLIAAGAQPGEAMGEKLKELETRWIDSGFTLDREVLLSDVT